MLFNNNQKLGIFCVVGFAIFFIILMQVHLMPGLIAGLLTYTLTLKLDAFLSNNMRQLGHTSKLISVTILLTIIMLIIIGGSWYLFTWFVDMAKNPAETMATIKPVIDNVSNALPESIKSYLPDDIEGIRDNITFYLKEHIFYLQSIIAHAFHILVILIVGMIIGLIFGFKHQRQLSLVKKAQKKPLVNAFRACIDRLVVVFQYVAISQCAIALFNAAMTAIFLFAILPIFGIHLPFSKSLVLATFVLGLIPIVGNLIVNVLMFLVAFTVSFAVSIAVIIYLILIHKVEYILNAKIVGTKIQAGICELLIAMLFCETLFGIIGLVFAPIFYAFIKLSLKDLKLI
ncbi:AI-2E family transporter [Orbus sturtevantii]|uniref:AI-2E family transporter n=1 Tax=Orbus sturtevantii TaxID=3074109 RepID=UPI00370D7DC8